MKKIILLIFSLSFIITHSEENLVKHINEYYKELTKHARLSAKNVSLGKAYENLTRLPELTDFLTFQGIVVNEKEISISRKKSNTQMGFFYPAFLYKKHDQLIIALDPLKNLQVKQQIKKLKIDLVDVKKEKKIQEKALKAISKTINKLSQKKIRAIAKLKKIDAKLSFLEERIVKGEDHLQIIRSSLRKNADEELELLAVIRRLNSSIAREINDIRRITLIRRRNVFERQRRTVQAEEDGLLINASNLQKQMKYDENKRLSLLRSRPVLEKDSQESLPGIEILEDEKTLLEEKINNLSKKISPLKQLLLQRKNVSNIVNEYENWWNKAQHRPKYHFLLALYAIQKFPKENYKINEKKWIGIGGIVEVHFR